MDDEAASPGGTFPRLICGILIWILCQSGQAETTSPPGDRAEVVAAIRSAAIEISGRADDYDTLLDAVGDSRLVLLGESTHGSAEFHRERARITLRLLTDKGFDAIILEAGWAPTVRLNAYVAGKSTDRNASEALKDFRRYPRWTWRNAEFATFIEELRTHNAALPPGKRPVAIYGMDIYETPEAAAQVVGYLEVAAPKAARGARKDYRCFDPYRRVALDPMHYGLDVSRGRASSCEKQVQSRLEEMRRLASESGDGAAFAAMMAARTVAGADAYYRAIYGAGGGSSWNVREYHLAESIDLILQRHKKAVVWAHNSHQGDARATGQGATGLVTIGQLMRERHGEECVFLVGLTTFAGTVRASTGWATSDRLHHLIPALPQSWPGFFHDTGLSAFLLRIRGAEALAGLLNQPLLDRAVGVSYFPAAEGKNHYRTLRLSRTYDALIHIDITGATEPIE